MKELIRVRVQYASRQQCCKTHKRPLPLPFYNANFRIRGMAIRRFQQPMWSLDDGPNSLIRPYFNYVISHNIVSQKWTYRVITELTYRTKKKYNKLLSLPQRHHAKNVTAYSYNYMSSKVTVSSEKFCWINRKRNKLRTILKIISGCCECHL